MSEPEESTGRDPGEVLAEVAARGIHCLQVPTPFAVGRVNCYLVEGSPLTLIDAGPRSDRSLLELESLLDAVGYRIEDIELVVATHQHIDHIGLVDTVVKRSGAEVAALDLAARRLAEFGNNSEAEDELAVSLMLSHGISPEIANTLRSLSSTYRDYGDAVTVTRPLPVGSILELSGLTLEVLHRPGHSPSDTVFWDRKERLAFGGDHLLSHISSNPLISRPLDGSPGRTRSLINYNESLIATRSMTIDTMLSGHGDPITDHVDLIDRRMAAQERRLEKIEGIISEQPRTAHSVAEAIWGNVAVTQAFLTLSEVIGHTDILQEQGRVTEREVDGLVIFEASS